MRTRKSPASTASATHIVTLHVYLREDGTYSASVHSWIPGGGKRSSHYLDGGLQEGLLAPPALSALTSAAAQALDAWWAGELD